ncbi:MAG: VanZ family protein [Clostridiaceae bacterium]|nr:VanZ family protein [Clostridiaceae bacterium]
MLHSFLKYITLLLTLLWFLFSTYLSHQPGEATAATSLHLAELLGNTGFFEVGELNGILRKAAHVVTFAVLSFLLYATLDAWGKTLAAWKMSKVWIVGVFVWCFVDEVTKVFVPGRHFGLWDCVLNLVGCLIGMVVGAVIL